VIVAFLQHHLVIDRFWFGSVLIGEWLRTSLAPQFFRRRPLNFDRTSERKNKLEELARLKRVALEALERRGYDVRGKSPAQIRQVLKRRPKKARAN